MSVPSQTEAQASHFRKPTGLDEIGNCATHHPSKTTVAHTLLASSLLLRLPRCLIAKLPCTGGKTIASTQKPCSVLSVSQQGLQVVSH
jgi:hypothetical protein